MLGKEPCDQLLLILGRSDVCYSWMGSCEDQARGSLSGKSLAMHTEGKSHWEACADLAT